MKLNKEGREEISSTVNKVGSNLEMVMMVGGLPGAIGYVSFGTVRNLEDKGGPIRFLTLDGVAMKEENIVNGSYPILRELNLVYQKKTAKISKVLDFSVHKKGRG